MYSSRSSHKDYFDSVLLLSLDWKHKEKYHYRHNKHRSFRIKVSILGLFYCLLWTAQRIMTWKPVQMSGTLCKYAQIYFSGNFHHLPIFIWLGNLGTIKLIDLPNLTLHVCGRFGNPLSQSWALGIKASFLTPHFTCCAWRPARYYSTLCVGTQQGHSLNT